MPDEAIRTINFGKQSEKPCYNQEIADLLEICDDAIRQLTACPSAPKRNWQEADLKIIRHIHGNIQGNIDEFAKDPEQYAPNADSTEMSVGDPPVCAQPENLGALILSRQLARFRTQLRNGSSAERTTGFHPTELAYSIQPMMTKLDAYITKQQADFDSGEVDYFPDVRDQEANETTPGSPE